MANGIPHTTKPKKHLMVQSKPRQPPNARISYIVLLSKSKLTAIKKPQKQKPNPNPTAEAAKRKNERDMLHPRVACAKQAFHIMPNNRIYAWHQHRKAATGKPQKSKT